MLARRAAIVLACLAVTASLGDGALIPWFGSGRRGRDDASTAAVSPLSDVGLLADPFRILEQIPFGFDRDDVAMVTMLARVDWRETPDSHEIVVDVPGMRREDLKIEVEENRVLRISGERRREEEQKGEHWHREERSYGRFWRQFRLPDNADLDTVAAGLNNGVLTVRFRKLAPEQIRGPRVVGIAGGDDGEAAKKTIAAGAGAGAEPQAKKVEL
jgi:HSP20 family protein